MPKAVGISGLTRVQLIDALRQIQHFCPPRPTKQDKATLIGAVWTALRSDRYCEQMASALKSVGFKRADKYVPPRDETGNFIK